MLETVELTEKQWQTAHVIAQNLVKENADVNEVGKAIAYLRAYSEREKAGAKFFDYLKTLQRNGRQVGHSKKTSEYYETLERFCSQYLKAYQEDAKAMLTILGWSARLMRYYKEAGPVEEITAPTTESASGRQAEIAEVAHSQKFVIDQILDATVLSIKGNKVTYEILGVIKLTEKEPKKAVSLKEGQVVQVKITALKEDGSIKSVKLVD